MGEFVAPHAGAWIETMLQTMQALKAAVAPHAGAWIETSQNRALISPVYRRTPRGCVD